MLWRVPDDALYSPVCFAGNYRIVMTLDEFWAGLPAFFVEETTHRLRRLARNVRRASLKNLSIRPSRHFLITAA
jgi:hypothetical protein